jgi:serine/threonine protein kinase
MLVWLGDPNQFFLSTICVRIDSDGYPVIIDFGFAKYVTDKTYTLCGTPLYLPPEVILNRGHNWSADHWSLGVLIFEMITGDTPFYTDGMEQMTLFRTIVKGQFSVPRIITDAGADIIKGFLTKDPAQRLGSLAGGENDVYAHKWFSSINFHTFHRKEIRAPHIPVIKDPLDSSNFDDWSHLGDKWMERYPKLNSQQQAIFEKF